MRRRHFTILTVLLCMLVPAALEAQGRGMGQVPGGRGQRPPRDAVRPVRPGTASISGRVVAAETGRPLKRARVVISSSGGPPRSVITDEAGRFRLAALPAGTYTVTASKTGFVDGAFGQRRSRDGGTPIQIAGGQQLGNVDVALLRGAVIAGRVLDEDGEPLARTTVQALRYQYQRGERRLVPAGLDQTDDRGQYRIFGLPAGDYVVSASAAGSTGFIRRVLIEPPPLAMGFDDQAVSTGYAPTYYPGVMTAAEASRVRVGVAQEMNGIDFQLQLVPLTTVRGTTADPRGAVMLVPEDGVGPMRMPGLRAPVQTDGTFTIANVPPGKYVAVARADGAGGPATVAMQPVLVAGDEVHVALTPMKGSRLAGALTFESSTTPPPAVFSAFRVTAQPLGAALVFPRAVRPADADAAGRFALADVMPGQYVIHAAAPRGWTMKAVYLDGRDVTDQPVEVKGGENTDGLSIVFTDRISGMTGVVQRNGGTPADGVRVIAFAADARFWRPQGRRIQTARSDQTGAFRIDNLPPGEYLVVATDDVEQGEWFDPAFLESARDKGVRVTLSEGEQKTLTLKAS